MAEIINLREFRKSRERTSKSAWAAENRAKSGRNKAEAARDRDAADRAKAEIDGKKIECGESDHSADPK
tara:strand:+ start:1104 stop:1310 length:207 start_codon:yes stop_codon:yes gene_type:complete